MSSSSEARAMRSFFGLNSRFSAAVSERFASAA